MKFPIYSAFEPLPYGPTKVGTILRVDGSSGIPPAFGYAVTTSEATGRIQCDSGAVAMTDEQWDEWKDQENAEYILDSVAADLGLVRVKGDVAPHAGPKKKTHR